jgi:hypothetical protein
MEGRDSPRGSPHADAKNGRLIIPGEYEVRLRCSDGVFPSILKINAASFAANRLKPSALRVCFGFLQSHSAETDP